MDIVHINTRGAYEAYQRVICDCWSAGEDYCNKLLERAGKLIEDETRKGKEIPDEWIAQHLAAQHVLQFLRGERKMGQIMVRFEDERFIYEAARAEEPRKIHVT